MHGTPTLPDTEMEAMRREHSMRANAIRDVFLEERMKEGAGMRRKQSRPGTMLRGERKHDTKIYPVEEAREFRMHILGMSMFPNIYSGLALTKMGPN
jgi:hypothetical protein